MWWRYLKNDNPFYVRFIRQREDYSPQDFKFSGIALSVWTAGLMGLCSTLSICGVLSHVAGFGGGSLFLFLLIFLGGMFLFFAPIALGISAATLTARDARAEPFDLLLLSNLTEAQIVWGYWGAIVHRFRWRGILLTPLVPYTLIFTGLVFSVGFLSDWRILAIWLAFVGLTVGSYSGWYWSSQMLGLIAGLALRNMHFVREIVGALILLLTVLWGWGLLLVLRLLDTWLLGQSAENYLLLVLQLVLVLVWFIAPFAIGWGASRGAYHFVRYPLGEQV